MLKVTQLMHVEFKLRQLVCRIPTLYRYLTTSPMIYYHVKNKAKRAWVIPFSFRPRPLPAEDSE